MRPPKYQIFVSSTYVDLKVERDQVVRAILEMGHIPVGMEMFSASDESQWQVIERTIEQTDYYVLIVAHRYGSIEPSTGISYTEKEYSYAESLGIPTLGFVIDGGAPWPSDRQEGDGPGRASLSKFKERVRRKICSSWESGADLAGKVSIALTKQFLLAPRPGWVRASDAVTPQIANEMARLSEENSQLRERLALTAGAGNAVMADWKSYFDHCDDLAAAYALFISTQNERRGNPSQENSDKHSEAQRKALEVARDARKALGRLKLEKNPVNAEAMANAAKVVEDLLSGKPVELEKLRVEVAAALA